ncbi:ectonucleotide pyrophosphatase/phosphodiesterase [Oleisolibacter albus]|uniref:alkaline phosphatase family protein n=1 Tax=Oleisolibacter albus TaxID=2171757 RepID=UPI000DF16EBB|nr:ectonucleotide pyrophosphatase/phosphodiesterase [Oleisolibacter albus]
MKVSVVTGYLRAALAAGLLALAGCSHGPDAPVSTAGPAAPLAAAPTTAAAPSLPAVSAGPVILISIDGFRPDYLTRGVTPALNALAADGALAEGMRPSFPSKTFPNHYTLVTGLRPDHHGIVNNSMEDAAIPGVTFTLSNTAVSHDPRWWEQATPIWVTAERQGVRTATMFWPGSDLPIHGVLPSDWRLYDGKVPSNDRVDVLLGWLDRPAAERPRFLTLYFEAVDSAGHYYGPSSPKIIPALQEVDQAIARLVDGLKQRGLYDSTNLILVADHGMADVPPNHAIPLESLVPPDVARPVSDGAGAGMVPFPGKEAEAERLLLQPHAHVQCWKKAEIPARFQYGTNPRVPPIYCMPDVGWAITVSIGTRKARPPMAGNHGYDNAAPEMAALFLAHGPAFRRGVRIPAFDNVDVYPLLTALAGIRPEPHDGSLDGVRPALAGIPAS